jgi:hypothetical protein
MSSDQGRNRERDGQSAKDQHDSAGNPVMSGCVYGGRRKIEQRTENLDRTVRSC